jgi:hypothetical protein
MFFMQQAIVPKGVKSFAGALVDLAAHTLYNPRRIHIKLKRGARSPQMKGTAVA